MPPLHVQGPAIVLCTLAAAHLSPHCGTIASAVPCAVRGPAAGMLCCAAARCSTCCPPLTCTACTWGCTRQHNTSRWVYSAPAGGLQHGLLLLKHASECGLLQSCMPRPNPAASYRGSYTICKLLAWMIQPLFDKSICNTLLQLLQSIQQLLPSS